MSITKLSCPRCQAVLKSTKPLPEGKRITCVKCKEPFLVSAALQMSSTGDSHAGSALMLAETFAGTMRSPMADLVISEAVVPQAVSSAAMVDAAATEPAPTSPLAFSLGDPTQPLVVLPRRRKSHAGLVVGLAALLLLGGGGIGLAVYLANREATTDGADLEKKLAAGLIQPPKDTRAIEPKKQTDDNAPKKEDPATKAVKDPVGGKDQGKAKNPPKKDPVIVPASFPGEKDAKKIQEAIDKGVRFLKEAITPSGSWMAKAEQHSVGYAALPGLALLECGVPAGDPVVQRAAAFIRQHSAKLDDTYDLGLAVLFLDRLGDPTDRTLVRSLALRLVAGQTQVGGWDYKCPVLNALESEQLMTFLNEHRPKIEWANLIEGPVKLPNLIVSPGSDKTPAPKKEEGGKSPSEAKKADPKNPKKPPAAKGGGLSPRVRNLPIVLHKNAEIQGIVLGAGRDDNSNTQFGLLGLWAARRHDVPTELSLELSAQRFQQTQNGTGGWGYVVMNPSKNTMTCVGLLGLAMGHGSAAEAFLEATAKGKKPPQLPEDPYIKEALQTMAQYLEGDHDVRGIESRIELYYLWTLERVGLLYNRKTFGSKDWYQWGSTFILDKQRPDCGWQVHYPPPIDTSFALLFLKRSNLVKDLHDNLQFYMAITK